MTQDNITEIAKSGGTVGANMGERAFLVQSLPQIDKLCGLYPEFADGIRAPCAWGENATVTNLSSDNVCIGDTFHVFGPGGQKRSLELEVASSRRPCANGAIAY